MTTGQREKRVRPQATGVCQQCNRAFSRDRYRILAGENKYCSRKCYDLGRSHAEPQRFWSSLRTMPNGCREWTGAPMQIGGYGRLRVYGQKAIKAHQYAWMLANGPIPSGLLVCHHCDNPLCCNPEHLFVGTAFDNMRDMAAKGRAAGSTRIGEAHPMVKLTAEQVRQIRSEYINKSRYGNVQELATKYGVTKCTIWGVATRRKRLEVQ